MAEGQHYRYDDVNSVQQRVILARPRGVGATIVYVPPIGGALPYTVTFEEHAEAVAFGSTAQAATAFHGQTLLETHDVEEWWLSNLTPVV